MGQSFETKLGMRFSYLNPDSPVSVSDEPIN